MSDTFSSNVDDLLRITDIQHDQSLFSKVELFTITLVCSFITLKLLNALYDSLYEPVIDSVVQSGNAKRYVLKIGNHYIPADGLVQEIIKWAILLLVVIVIYNVLRNHRTDQFFGV